MSLRTIFASKKQSVFLLGNSYNILKQSYEFHESGIWTCWNYGQLYQRLSTHPKNFKVQPFFDWNCVRCANLIRFLSVSMSLSCSGLFISWSVLASIYVCVLIYNSSSGCLASSFASRSSISTGMRKFFCLVTIRWWATRNSSTHHGEFT